MKMQAVFSLAKREVGGGGRALGRMRQGWHMCEVCSTMLVYLVGKGQCVHLTKNMQEMVTYLQSLV
jgi:hypothetical protein